MIVFIQKVYLYLIIMMLFMTSGCDYISQDADSYEMKESNKNRGVPEWLLISHRSLVESESINDAGLKPVKEDPFEQKPDLTTAPAKPEQDTVNDSKQPVATPDQKQKPQSLDTPSADESSVQDNQDPSREIDVDRAKDALKAIEKEYKNANQERKAELMSHYNQIIRGLKYEFGITYESNLGEDWWDLEMDYQPSLEHNVNFDTN